jgi:hypothetical protein
MKCIQCDTDNNLKDRVANRGLCKNCEHPFAFEPTLMKDVQITDPFFAKAIADISLSSTLFFTPRQFLYFLDKRCKYTPNNWTAIVAQYIVTINYVILSVVIVNAIDDLLPAAIRSIGLSLILGIFSLSYAFFLLIRSNSPEASLQSRNSNAVALQIIGSAFILLSLLYLTVTESGIDLIFALNSILGILIFGLGFVQATRIKNIINSSLINNNQIQDWLRTWVNTNGQIDRLLPAPLISIESSGENNLKNTDVTDYSFDRLVVCHSNEIAQMLIANNFHFENNCAILSIDGYPAAVFDTVLQMLRRNPDLMVYAFHDASPDGVSLVHQLRNNPTWFVESTVTIVDLGLLPRQVLANSRNLFIHRTATSATSATELAPAIRQNFTDEELAWLDAGNYVELESFTPQRLIKILNRGIASEASGVIWTDDIGSNVYANESFG